MKRCNGLTIFEVLLALSLIAISILAFFYVYRTSLSDRERREIVGKLLFEISRIETALLHYYSIRNGYPLASNQSSQPDNILAKLTNGDEHPFVKYFLKQNIPEVPEGFDRSYGRGGFKLFFRSFNNIQEYYLCLRVVVKDADDVRFLALKEIVNNFPNKAYYHYSDGPNDIESENCPATANKPDPMEPKMVYLTYWITRQNG